MVTSCAAIGCKKRFKKDCGIAFHRFPTTPRRRAKWIVAVNRKNWAPGRNGRVCGVHFISGRKSDNPLSPDYVPSIFSFSSSSNKRKINENLEKLNKHKCKQQKRTKLKKCTEDSLNSEPVSSRHVENSYCCQQKDTASDNELLNRESQEVKNEEVKVEDAENYPAELLTYLYEAF